MIWFYRFAHYRNGTTNTFSMAASCELKVGPSWASAAASPGILRQRILFCLSFSVDSQDYNWHILILQAGKKSLKHSDGSAKHEDIMKLQQSHVVLTLKSIHVEENTFLRRMHCPNSLNHCRAEKTGRAIEMPMPLENIYIYINIYFLYIYIFSRCSSHATRCQYQCR